MGSSRIQGWEEQQDPELGSNEVQGWEAVRSMAGKSRVQGCRSSRIQGWGAAGSRAEEQ